ncbi:MAG TPA: glycoside hydrolase family 3 C-terminal domain-containing protein, partial [Polyangia bacterium]|nr:glycoside hydrolase family 3 C-terminal domain-containing protein [Polyangia bacterium]
MLRAVAALVVLSLGGAACVKTAVPPGSPPDRGAADPYRDPARLAPERARDLVARMTLAEKVGQMVNDAPAIPRLGVPAYDWWNEGLHGVGRAGIATVFPQAIGLAAMWDEPFLREVATAISDEARAKHHEAARRGRRGRYQGLTYFSPNVNLFRDPRWGRGQETYGEDPYLTARLGVAFIQGMQGQTSVPASPPAPATPSPSPSPSPYLKLVATAKHFAVHSGPEAVRHSFDVRVSAHDLRDSYLPQFEACVREGGAGAVMPAYNRVDGEPCAASPRLLQGILRGEWGFGGFVVSDCGAIDDIYREHRVAGSAEEAAALALRAGTDISCGGSYRALVAAVKRGLASEADVDRAVVRLFAARFALGMFDAPERVSWARIPIEVVDSPAHRALAKVAAQKSMVLLKNQAELLPLQPTFKAIAVVGPTADDQDVLLGNYNGKPSRAVTILDGLRAKARARGVELRYAKGCGIASPSARAIGDAVAVVARPDVGAAVVVLGLSPRLEGEEGDSALNPGGDRRDLALPGVQERLLQAVVATGKPTVLVLTGGSALGLEWAKANVPAILVAWYPGEEGGTAVADVLFGDYNPAGRLPVTFYRSVQDLPAFEDYAMTARTYRYFRGEPTYPFGHGRSFTTFAYRDLRIAPERGDARGGFQVGVEVANTGGRAGDEVVQLYLTDEIASAPVAIRALAGFRRVALAPGERRRVEFALDARALSFVDAAGRRRVEPGA